MASMPIKFLLQTAERDQDRYGSIFAQLLKLCTTQFPHTCIVKDWLEEEDVAARPASAADSVSQAEVAEAFACIAGCPSKLTLALNKLMGLPIEEVWGYADVAIKHITEIMAQATSRQIKGTR
jgi:integrator complex subunit 2